MQYVFSSNNINRNLLWGTHSTLYYLLGELPRNKIVDFLHAIRGEKRVDISGLHL